MDLHEVARQVAKTADADFAFVLNRSGQLVTRDAPRDMPERGRTKILLACPTSKNGEITLLEMAREDLVPFGGAAPIDVFAVRVEDTAILALVMSSWHDKGNVVLALTTGAASLGEMIRKAKRARAQKAGVRKPAEPRRDRAATLPPEPRRERTSALPGEPRRERASSLPGEPRRERASSLPRAPKEATAAKKPAKVEATRASRAEPPPLPRAAPAARRRTLEPRRPSSAPEIELGEATMGRETMIAIGALREGQRPSSSPEIEIELGEAKVGRETMIAIENALREDQRPSSAPEIELGEAAVGRETLIAIEGVLPRAPSSSSPDAIRVQLDSIGPDTLFDIRRVEVASAVRAPTVEESLVKEERRTLPWVDAPSALKRALDAKAAARGAAPPDVKVAVVAIDADTLEGALREGEKR